MNSPLFYLTQSLWRDEAFSVLIAESPIAEIIRLTASDFNPPLYYLILHFWMKLFGEGEIAIRMLSFIFHIALVYTVYKFAKFLKFGRLTTNCLLLTTFLNPMLLYYAFETRMYSLLALLATASMYFFYFENWPGYIITSALGLWTQPFMGFVILSQIVYSIWVKRINRHYLASLLGIFMLYVPWMPTLISQLAHSGPMWIWPINMTTVITILGNTFTAYEGTPGGLWEAMAILSGVILLISFIIIKKIKQKKLPLPAEFLKLLLVWLFLPVVLVLLISYFKPIYVNRYIIFVTVAEVFIMILGISLIQNRLLRLIFYTFYFIFITGFNLWFPSRHAKLDIRATMNEINYLLKPQDYIYCETPLTFLETNYYAQNRSRVFLYNPNLVTVPVFVGQNLMPKNRMAVSFPNYPSRAFLIHDDGSYEVIFKN